MGGRSSLPNPGERSNSDSLGPISLLWSPWMELGATNNQVLVLRLNTNPELVTQIFSAKKLYQIKLLQFNLQNTFLTISLFPNEFLEVHFS